MSVGSLSSSTVSSSSASLANASSGAPVKADETPSIADHVAAAADSQEPIRSASTTQGTLVDTYL